MFKCIAGAHCMRCCEGNTHIRTVRRMHTVLVFFLKTCVLCQMQKL